MLAAERHHKEMQCCKLAQPPIAGPDLERQQFGSDRCAVVDEKQHHQKVEVRIVLHQQTIGRLVQTCEFLVRNLLFVDHVALMGLEITGFTRPNLDILWIDPYEYKAALSEAVALLTAHGVPTSVYNHQLCTVNPDIWESCRQSISDWKREYVEECAGCSKRTECGGLFSSSKAYRHSSHIRAFT